MLLGNPLDRNPFRRSRMHGASPYENSSGGGCSGSDMTTCIP
ncbi:hypothetical protein V3C99_003645 [Haemonchus contortus]